MRGWIGVLFLRPCEDACGRGLSIGIRGKYDMGSEVKSPPRAHAAVMVGDG